MGVTHTHLLKLQETEQSAPAKVQRFRSASREGMLSEQHHVVLLFRSRQAHLASLQFGLARFSLVRSGAAGLSGLDFAASEIGF